MIHKKKRKDLIIKIIKEMPERTSKNAFGFSMFCMWEAICYK
jgi:hypothetical protein